MKNPLSNSSVRSVSNRIIRAKHLGFLLASSLLLVPSAHAAQKTWTGAASTAWATGGASGNWSGAAAPTNDLVTDTALFNSAGYTNQPNAGTTSIAGIEVGGSSGVLTISGTSLSIGATGLQIDNGAGAVTLSPTAVKIGANQNWSNNSSSLLTVGAVTNVGNVNAFTLTLNGSGTGGTSITGIISNGGSVGTTAVVVNAAGTTTFSGANTFTGGLTLTSGTLSAITSNQSLGKGALNLNGGTLELNNSALLSFSSGGLGTTTVGGTTTIVSDKNASGAGVTYTFGALSIGANTLNVSGGPNVATGTAGVTFGATTLTGNATFNITNPTTASTVTSLTVGATTLGGNSLTLTGNGNFAQTGVFAADGGSLVLGVNGGTAYSGSATLNQNNLNTGGVTINSGTLNINAAGVAGTSGPLGTGTFTVNGGTIGNTSGASKAVLELNPIAITGDFNFGQSGQLTTANLSLGGAITMATDHTITMNGAAALSLTGTLTNTGDSARTLNVSNGSGTAATSILTLGGYNLTGAGSTAARTDIIGGSGTVTISGVIADGVSAGSGLNYDGSGALNLTGSNTFTGGLTISSGKVNINGSGTLTPTAVSPLGTGTFTINGGTIDNTSGAARIVQTPNAIVIGNDFAFSTSVGTTANNLTLGVAGANNGGITMAADHTITLNGSGVLALTGTLTNTGDSARTLTVNDSAGSTSSLTLGGYVLTGAGSTAARNDIIAGNGDVTITGVISDGASAGSGLTYNGTGTLDISSGYTTASGTGQFGSVKSTYTGNTTINSGSLLFYGTATGDTPLGTGTTIFLNGGDLSSNANGSNGGAQITQNLTVGANDSVTLGRTAQSRISFGSTGTNSFGANSTTTFYGATIFTGSLNTIGSGATLIEAAGNGALNSFTAAQMTLGGNVTFTNNASVLAGSMVFSGAIDSAGSTNAIDITGTGGSYVELTSASSAFGGGVTLSSGWLAIGANNPTVVGGAVTKGSLGTGTLTLNTGKVSGDAAAGSHNFLVGNVIDVTDGSTVTFGDTTNNAIGTYKGTVNVGKNATLTSPIASYLTTIAGTSGTNTITVGSTSGLAVGELVTGTGIASGTTITAISGGTITLSSATTGIPSGTATFNGINTTIFGPTTATTGAGGGGVVLTGSGSVVTLSPEAVAGNPTIASTMTFDSVISDGGNGNGINVGDGTSQGTVIFAAANTYTGATTIQSGVADYTNGTAFGGNSAITVKSGATAAVSGGITGGSQALTLSGNGLTAAGYTGALDNVLNNNSYAGAITLAGATTISADAGSLTLSGGINNAGFQQTFNGGATVVLSGAGSGSGGTTIENGTTLKDGITNALATTTVLTMGNGTDSGNKFDLNGNNQTVAGVTNGSTSTAQTITNGAAGSGTSTLTVSGSGTGYTYSGVIQDGATAHTALTQSGTNTFTLTGTNSYTGATTVSSGNLTIGSTGSLAAGSAVSVTGGTLNVLGNVGGSVSIGSGGTLSGNGNGTTTGVVGALTVAGGGIINTQDGTIGTLGGSTLTLAAGGGNAVLDLDISTGHTADLLTFSGAASFSNVFTVNVDSLLGAGTGTYTIATASGGGLAASDFSAGSLTGLSGDTMTFQQSGNSILLVISAGGAESTSYYFTGAGSNDFTNAGNYSSAASGGTTHVTGLSSTSNVFLNATSPSNTPATLNANASINSLNFITAGTSLAGSGTVTLAATGTAGITDSTGASGQTETVAPGVVLGSNQSWAATANSTLNVTGAISGPQTLALTGNGTYKFAGSNTFQGLTVGTGSDTPTLFLTNGTSGSATGTTTLRVNAGATLAGNGTSSGTSFNISGTGTATGARANVLVGLTSTIDTTVGNKLTLIGSTGTSTIADANLTFNLSATSTASNQLSVGNTAIAFGTDAGSVKFSLNLENEPAIVGAFTTYTLIAGTSSVDQYTGLTLGTSTTVNGVTETIITSNNLQVAFGNSTDTSYYGNGSYLVLYQSAGVDDIDVVVVPEPGTWAMMLGGLALLIFWQRRKAGRS